MIGKLMTQRWMHIALLFILLIFAVFHSDSNARWRQEMQYFVFDELNRMYPREKSDELIIVNIDDDSLLELGQWPWPRTILAKMVDNLSALGAKAIVFDGVLAEPDRTSPKLIAQSLQVNDGSLDLGQVIGDLENLPDHDALFAESVKESERFVSAFTWGSYSAEMQKSRPRIKQALLAKRAEKTALLENVRSFESTANFLPQIEKAAAGNGSFMATPDPDGVLRTTSLIFTDGKQLYPSLSLEAIRVAGGKPWRSILVTPSDRGEESSLIDTALRIHFDDYAIPIEADGKVNVYYRRFDERGDDYLSAYKVIDEAFHDDISALVKDRIVLIGASAEGLKDLRSTALEAFQPGVEIHANVIEQIIQNKYLLRPDITKGAEAFFIFLFGGLMILLAPFINVLVLSILCGGLVFGAFSGTAYAYQEYGLLFDPFYPSLSVGLILIVSVFMTYLRVESEKRQVRSAFGLYISPDFMKELTSNPDKLQLGGEIRDLSVMFTDIRSFTTISEGLSPQELIQLMNDFLTPMSDLVMQNRGTIDKYMGDAMMAFWNAPLDDAEHEYHACKTALSMQAALDPINEVIKEKASGTGKKPVLLQAGIGINTGPCAVGNMGSRQRFAYSTLGDAVNLASRLEGQTKNYGVSILIGEATYNKVPQLASLEMDLIKVKGKEKAERIFALLAGEEVASTDAFKILKAQHEIMITSYRTGAFEEALEAIKECRKQDLFDLDFAYDMYESRIEELLKNPPEHWDGVYVATSK